MCTLLFFPTLYKTLQSNHCYKSHLMTNNIQMSGHIYLFNFSRLYSVKDQTVAALRNSTQGSSSVFGEVQEVKQQSATHTSLCLLRSPSLSCTATTLQQSNQLHSLTQNMWHRNEQSDYNCCQLIMLTFLWYMGPALLSVQCGERRQASMCRQAAISHTTTLHNKAPSKSVPAQICSRLATDVTLSRCIPLTYMFRN